MNQTSKTYMDEALTWCAFVLGPIAIMADHSKEHGGHVSSTRRLRAAQGFCYLKVHQSQAHWQQEVHAYEQWRDAFGDHAPRLLAARDTAPYALVVTELPGQIAENMTLQPTQERALWHAAGAALVALHELESGDYFGPCRRDGSPAAGEGERDASQYVAGRLQTQLDQAISSNYLNDEELATLRAAHTLTPAFAGERPTACHRDYCAANWLVNEDGDWSGVIDFEFAHWDVRVTDFSRDPNWNWMHRPDLLAAFFAGYGRSPTATEEKQLLVTRAEYALGAIIWGTEHAFYGFAQEGHDALAYLKPLLNP
ncbi:MAG: aminoglycoside phosphotransferase family protein [Anaerolineales bacterium]|nr:aminoglycoside phosphotransferase family protein [Anaerolineales bacterium]